MFDCLLSDWRPLALGGQSLSGALLLGGLTSEKKIYRRLRVTKMRLTATNGGKADVLGRAFVRRGGLMHCSNDKRKLLLCSSSERPTDLGPFVDQDTWSPHI